LYALSVGGIAPTTPFAYGELVNGTGTAGYEVTALAATTSNRDSYSTSQNFWSIAGVEIRGTEQGSPTLGVNVPGVQPTIFFNISFTVTSSSLVVFMLTAGGQCCLSASGIPGFTILARESFAGGNAIEIAAADLVAGHYTVMEQSYNHDEGGNSWADIIGVFQFGPVGGSGGASTALPWWIWLVGGAAIGAAAVGLAMVVGRPRRPRLPAPRQPPQGTGAWPRALPPPGSGPQ
jgi:hypothetical protein